MKLNFLFLVIGILISVSSKALQYLNKEKIGNILVFPAASFFVLAILFSIPKYMALLNKVNGLQQAATIAFLACLAVFSFQMMMILLIGYHNKLGFFLLIPLALSVTLLIYKWTSSI